MNRYRHLQALLKPLKARGLTCQKLNVCEAELLIEYKRLADLGLVSADESFKCLKGVRVSSCSKIESMRPESPINQGRTLSGLVEVKDAEIEPLLVKNWTDNPSLAIAIIAAYTAAGFAMAVLLFALITTTTLLSGRTFWLWIRKQIATLELQLMYFESPFQYSSFKYFHLGPEAPLRPLLIH